MSEKYDLIIVGAGIVGAACADECARAGMRVLILDRGPIGAGTTAAGMGHIVVMDDSEAQFALTSYSRSLWCELARELPADVEWVQCGTLWIAADDEEMKEVERKQNFYSERGVRVEILDRDALMKAEQNLRPGLAGALLIPEDAVVYPPCAARFFVERAISNGSEVRQNANVARILPEGGVTLTDGAHIPASRVVNAAGPWSTALNIDLPVRKRKGHLVVTDRCPGFVHHQLVELGYLKSAHGHGGDSVAFNIQPRKTGQILIGSSRQYDANSSEVEQGILDKMLSRSLEFMPALGGISATRVWTGHRAATPDKLPIIGPTSNDRIWIATGHEGLGITTSTGTAKILADLLLGRLSRISAAPYSPARFPERQNE